MAFLSNLFLTNFRTFFSTFQKHRKMSLGDPRALLNSERSRRKTMTLQLPLAALSTVNVVDTKYDSDSDFDYRPKPPRYRVNSRNRKTCPLTYQEHLGPKLLSMEMPIPNFCSRNRHGDSMSRSSEFGIPIEFRTSALGIAMAIP